MKLDGYTQEYKHVLNFKQKILIKWCLYFVPLLPLELPIFDRDKESSNQLLIFYTQLGRNFLDPWSTSLHSGATDFHHRAWDLITFISAYATITIFIGHKNYLFFLQHLILWCPESMTTSDKLSFELELVWAVYAPILAIMFVNSSPQDFIGGEKERAENLGRIQIPQASYVLHKKSGGTLHHSTSQPHFLLEYTCKFKI